MTERSSSSRGPGRPPKAEVQANLADELEQTLKGLAELLEPSESDVDTIAGILKRDAAAIARYLASLADKSTAAAAVVKRVLNGAGAVRAFGPLVGALFARVTARRAAASDVDELHAEFARIRDTDGPAAAQEWAHSHGLEVIGG